VAPTKTITLPAAPDAQGVVWQETWSGDASAWLVEAGVQAAPPTVQPNDGIMGSPFLRLPSGASLQITTPLRWFDQTQPAKWSYRFRFGTTSAWMGTGVLYTGEGNYDGLTWSPADGNPSTPEGWGLYPDFGGGFVPGYGSLASISPGDVFDVEMEWMPEAVPPQIRARAKPIHPTPGAWTDWVAGPAEPVSGQTAMQTLNSVGINRGLLVWPASLYFGGGVKDIGPVTLTASRLLYGAADFFGWRDGDFDPAKPAAFFGATDPQCRLGGLTGMPSDVPAAVGMSSDRMIEFNVGGAQQDEWYGFTASPWRWTSAKIVPAEGCRLAALSFRAYNHAGGTKVQVRVRNAADDSLISDAIIPGNSTGLVSTAGIVAATAWPSSAASYMTDGATQRVSLSAVPEGTAIYLDVEGAGHDGYLAPGAFEANLPRLGGFWVAVHAPSGPRTVRVEAGGAPVLATVVPGADLGPLAGTVSFAAPALSAAPPLPTMAARGAMQLDVSAVVTLPSMAGVGQMAAPEFLSPETGHRIRVVAGGTAVVVNVVPGADLGGFAGATAIASVTLSAEVPLASMAGAGAMAVPSLGVGLSSFAGVGALVSPSFSAAVGLPTMAGKGSMRTLTIKAPGPSDVAISRWRRPRAWVHGRHW
jgi:hypothetical protein